VTEPIDEPAEGARKFQTTGDAYDAYMGRYSVPLAPSFAAAAGVRRGWAVLDVGCGPGALTALLVEQLGAAAVSACDPSAPFVAECARRLPGIDVRAGRAEALPFGDGAFDAALAQLVLQFVTDAPAAAAELRRVVRPGGVVAACVWDLEGGMEMLHRFWEAAIAVDPAAPGQAQTAPRGGAGELVDLFESAGLVDCVETTLTVSSTYADGDALWTGFAAGIGSAGSYCAALPDGQREAVRVELLRRLDAPTGPFTLTATARCTTARVPS
jgi:SAM-dependent methyltransferase